MVAPGVTVETDEQTYFRIIYRMPKQVLLTVPEWEDGVRDECVQRALAAGLMPVGEVLVGEPEEEEPDAGIAQRALPEGMRLDVSKVEKMDVSAFLEGFTGATPVSVDMCKVTAEVLLMGGMA